MEQNKLIEAFSSFNVKKGDLSRIMRNMRYMANEFEWISNSCSEKFEVSFLYSSLVDIFILLAECSGDKKFVFVMNERYCDITPYEDGEEEVTNTSLFALATEGRDHVVFNVIKERDVLGIVYWRMEINPKLCEIVTPKVHEHLLNE